MVALTPRFKTEEVIQSNSSKGERSKDLYSVAQTRTKSTKQAPIIKKSVPRKKESSSSSSSSKSKSSSLTFDSEGMRQQIQIIDDENFMQLEKVFNNP